MKRQRFSTEVVQDPGWWHWAVTIPLLAFSLVGHSWAGWTAIGLCAAVAGYYFWRLKQWRPYPVQVRIAYLVLLLCGMPPGMDWIFWVPLVGTTAMVIAGYCPLLRLLRLAPWNRTEPLSKSYVWQVFVRMPCAGGLLKWSATTALPEPMCCSLREKRSLNSCSVATARTDQTCIPEKDYAPVD